MRAARTRRKPTEERARESAIRATCIQVRPYHHHSRVAVRIGRPRNGRQGAHDNFQLRLLKQQITIRERLVRLVVRRRVRQIELSGGNLYRNRTARLGGEGVTSALGTGVV